MAKGTYIGVGGKARKVRNLYLGVGGKARKVKRRMLGSGERRDCSIALTQPVKIGKVEPIDQAILQERSHLEMDFLSVCWDWGCQEHMLI